jgi:hypothetical protein
MLDAEDGSYRSAIDVYACWHLSDMKIISKHIVSGEIIFQRSCSGGDVDFYKVEPGKAKKFNPFK